MSIKPSAAAEIRTLIASLGSGDEIRRESAIARLAVIGPRAVDRIVAAYESAGAQARAAMLRALEAIADPRALGLARDALSGGGDVAVAATGALHALLDTRVGTAGADALDALVAAALSPAADRRVRVAALDALRDMPHAVHTRIEHALRDDKDPALRARATGSAGEPAAADAVWQDALEGRLPDDPAVLREALAARGSTAPLGVLQKLVDAVNAREGRVETALRDGWVALRGALHQALALRGSPIAVYDLRESVAGATRPLPTSFITALHAVGDESCLEAIAAAHEAAGRQDGETSETERWRHQLGAAFHAIAAREKVTRRSSVLKRINARWPVAAEALSTPSRTKPRRTNRGRT